MEFTKIGARRRPAWRVRARPARLGRLRLEWAWEHGLRLSATITDLETFLAVADLQSFSRAAERLCISQPAVSARINRLEAMLGARLIDRSTRRLSLTTRGEGLRLGAERVMGDLRALLEGFGVQDAPPRAALDVVCTGGIAALFMPGLMRAFAAEHPDIAVRLHERAPPAAIQAIRTGGADLGVIAIGEPPPDIEFIPLVDDECVVVAPTGHPLLERGQASLAEILAHPILMTDYQTPLRRTVQALADARGLTFVRSPESRHARSILGMFSMVASGYGLMIQPASLARLNVDMPLGLVRISDVRLPHVYGLASLASVPPRRAASVFKTFAVARSQAPRPDGAPEKPGSIHNSA